MVRFPNRWVAAAAVALLASSLMIPSVRATAAVWLTIFRAQEAQVVTIDLAELGAFAAGAGHRDGSPPMANGQILPELAQRINQLVQVEVIRNAEHRGGLSLREIGNRDFVAPGYLPAGFSDAGAGGEAMSSSERLYKVDVDGANAILALIGSKERLPAELKGEAIRVVQGQSTTFTYQGDQELVVMQGASPEISAPGKVDLNQLLSSVIGGLGSQFGLPTGLSDQLQAMDLSRTIPLPLIQGVSEEIKVKGATGAYYHAAGKAAVVWVTDGRVHAVYGTISRAELIRVAESIGG